MSKLEEFNEGASKSFNGIEVRKLNKYDKNVFAFRSKDITGEQWNTIYYDADDMELFIKDDDGEMCIEGYDDDLWNRLEWNWTYLDCTIVEFLCKELNSD